MFAFIASTVDAVEALRSSMETCASAAFWATLPSDPLYVVSPTVSAVAWFSPSVAFLAFSVLVT